MPRPDLLYVCKRLMAELEAIHREYLPNCTGLETSTCPTREIINQAKIAIAQAERYQPRDPLDGLPDLLPRMSPLPAQRLYETTPDDDERGLDREDADKLSSMDDDEEDKT